MENKILFESKLGSVSNNQLLQLLTDVKAFNTDILYIHTALNFGNPSKVLSKKEILQSLLDVLLELKVPTLIFPSYTFSFCNNQGYNVQESKTPMGLLNDYIRKQDFAIRSIDPLMSNVLIGKNTELVTGIGKCSVGQNSTFDLLHNSGLKVKFLFLGSILGDCFTYMHYIEEKLKVPYRYKRIFRGQITDLGNTYKDDYELYVRYSNVFPGLGSYIYENILLERGIALKRKIGDSSITIADEANSFETYAELIHRYPNFFIKEPFNDLEKTDEFHVKNMVAL